MQTHDRLLKRSVLPTLLGLTLLGGVAAAPAFAQSDRDHKMHHSKTWDDEDQMFDPAPLSYPQAAPGSLHLYHWKDYTQTKMETGSVSDKRWEMEHKKDKMRRDRKAQYHRTYNTDTMSESTTTGWSDNNEWRDMDQNGDTSAEYKAFWMDSPWNQTMNNEIVLWADPQAPLTGEGYVYVLRGDTVYQMRANDLPLAAQTAFPWLNNQIGYDMPDATQTEDFDVYNKAYADTVVYGNEDTERKTSDIHAYPDFPPDMAQANDNSDLKGRTFFHRSNPSTGPARKMPSTISVSGDYVYILRGNTLYQLRASDLSLVKKTKLPAADK